MIPRLTCACGRHYEPRPEHAGRVIRCRCGRELPIPGVRRRWPIPVRRGLDRALVAACWGWIAGVVGAVILVWVGGDRWWPGTIALYGPRWLVAVPAPFLLLGAILVRPRLLGPLVLGALLVPGPLLGFRTGWRSWLDGTAEGERDLRIVSFNMRGAENPREAEVPLALAALDPDVILIQECSAPLAGGRATPSGWWLRVDRTLCMLARTPPDSVEPIDLFVSREDGMSGLAALYRFTLPGGPLDLVNVHLETPRRGIEGVRYRGEIGDLSRNIVMRDAGSRRTARWIGARAPAAIVAGDFNLPVESVIYRSHWGHCANAFSRYGRGFGYTRILPRWSARIDHLLTCGDAWRVVAVRVGPDLGSDHLPLITDLRRIGR